MPVACRLIYPSFLTTTTVFLALGIVGTHHSKARGLFTVMSVWGIPLLSGFGSVIWMNSSQDKHCFLVEFICSLTGAGSSVWPLLPGRLEPAKKVWPFGLSVLGNAVNAKAVGQAFTRSFFSFFVQQWHLHHSLYCAGCSPSKNNSLFLELCLFGVGKVMWVGKGRKFLPLTDFVVIAAKPSLVSVNAAFSYPHVFFQSCWTLKPSQDPTANQVLDMKVSEYNKSSPMHQVDSGHTEVSIPSNDLMVSPVKGVFQHCL